MDLQMINFIPSLIFNFLVGLGLFYSVLLGASQDPLLEFAKTCANSAGSVERIALSVQLPQGWIYHSFRTPQAVHDLLVRIENLSSKEKKDLLSKLSRERFKSEKTQELVEMALYDESAWEHFMSQLIFPDGGFEGDFNPFLYGLRNMVEKMPPNLSETLRRYIGRKYNSLAFGKIDRRYFETFIQMTAPDARPKSLSDHDGTLNLKAYQNFLEGQRSLFANTKISDLSDEKIFKTIKDVQSQVVAYEKAHPGANAEVLFYGSVPNGKGHSERSDIDLSSMLPQEELNSLTAGIKKDEKPLKISARVAENFEKEFKFLGKLNPVAFRIRGGEIKLVVFHLAATPPTVIDGWVSNIPDISYQEYPISIP